MTTSNQAPEPLKLRLRQLTAILSSGAYRYDSEIELQDQIETRIRAAGLPYRREQSLQGGTRPDFLVGRKPWIALEVKIKGSTASVLRQVDGYLADDQVGAALVATTRAAHQQLPGVLHHKLLAVAWLAAAGALGGPSDAADAEPVPRVGQLIRTPDGWAVTLQPHAMARFKRLFPRVRDKHYGTVHLDSRRETARDLLWFCTRFPLDATELDRLHLQVEADKYDRQRARVAAVEQGTLAPRRFELALPLRPYQARAAEMALQSGGLLVADEVGLGKTATAIGTLADPATRPALVVTLTHLPDQWAEEIGRFAPDLKVHVIRKGSPYDVTRPKGARKRNGDRFHVPTGEAALDRPFPDVLITSYSKLAGWADTLAPIIRGVVYDEIQELRKGSETAKGAAAYHLSRNADSLRLGLSATPSYNYANEYWAINEALRPGALGTGAEFVQEWCVGQGMGNYRVRDPRALGAWLRAEGLMIRRSRRDVGRELPPLNSVPVLIEADTAALEKTTREVAALAAAILAVNTPTLERGRAARELDWRLRQATGIAKAPFVAAFVQMLFADGASRVVLAGWHREVYRVWLDLLAEFEPVLYTGSESTSKKAEAKAAFVSGKSRLLIMSLRSGAGLDGLQDIGCHDVVFGELDWSPQVHHQLAGRVHRDGQPDPVTAWYLHSGSGSDPAVLEVLGVKRAQSAGVLDPTGQDAAPVADPSRARSLARRVLGMSS